MKKILRYFKYFYFDMIDRALGFTSPDRKNAYYFQFYPNKIKLKRG